MPLNFGSEFCDAITGGVFHKIARSLSQSPPLPHPQNDRGDFDNSPPKVAQGLLNEALYSGPRPDWRVVAELGGAQAKGTNQSGRTFSPTPGLCWPKRTQILAIQYFSFTGVNVGLPVFLPTNSKYNTAPAPMRRFFSVSSRFALTATMMLGSGTFVKHATAQTYDVRAQTRDKIRANVYDPAQGEYVMGKAYQGSFGAPSINDKGMVAYACILSGQGLDAFTNNSIVSRLAGQGTKQKARLVIQAGFVVSNTFRVPVSSPSYFVDDSAGFYRFGRDVAVNNKKVVSYNGQLLYTYATPSDKFTTYTRADASVYGTAIPFNGKAKSFNNIGVKSFSNFVESLLHTTMSNNIEGSVPYSALFAYTSSKSVPGIAFTSPTDGGVIATLESPVIGLPYFTTFQLFSEPVIAANNVAFVVADISDEGDEFDGIWQGNNPDLQPVVVKNNVAPNAPELIGNPTKGKYSTFDGTIGPSRNGKILAFIANIASGRTSRAVFRINVDGSGAEQVAGVGQVAPGVEPDGRATNFKDLTLAASNDAGQVAVLGTVDDKDSLTGNLSGIWVSDKTGHNLSLVVLEGQTMTVGGKEKRITRLAFNPVSGLNAKGQVAFTASFTDRTSAVIVATL
jgi:hypothetical protein